MLQHIPAQPDCCSGTNVNSLVLRPDLALPALCPVSLFCQWLLCELAQTGLSPDLTHMYARGYCNLAWSGLFLALLLALTYRNCIPIEESPKLLHRVSSQWQFSCIPVGNWPRLTLSISCTDKNSSLLELATPILVLAVGCCSPGIHVHTQI